MTRIELVKSAFDPDNRDRYSLYADDFKWTDEMGSPAIGKDAWSAMGKPMETAFPDLSLVIEDIREEGDGVVVTSRYSGTFTHDLDLSASGLGVIRATGKVIEFPTGTDLVSFEDGQISELHNRDSGPDAGFAGFLKALGVNGG